MKKLDRGNYVFSGSPVRITWHWTGGSYTPSSLDAEHYQFLIAWENGEAVVYEGKYTVADQDSTANNYAAHTKGFNTRNIGISVCGMAGSQENGTFGNYPLTEGQIDELISLSAWLCDGYGIPTTAPHLASHCEIQSIHGVPQNGKWDISCLDYVAATWTTLNDSFRSRVVLMMADKAPVPPAPPEDVDDDMTGLLISLRDTAAALARYADELLIRRQGL